MKWLVLVLSLLFFFAACKEKKEKEFSFEMLMGQKSRAWQYVQTPEDNQRLSFFKNFYEEDLQKPHKKIQSIPKILHIVWVGRKGISKKLQKTFQEWHQKHPQWKVKFWTDRPRKPPFHDAEVCEIKDFSFYKLKECFFDCKNFAEQEALFRYEILFQEGGVAIDGSFAPLVDCAKFHSQYDFYCSLSIPLDPIASSSIFVSNGCIAAKPKHPILKESLERIHAKWNKRKEQFPISNQESSLYLIFYRTFMPFDKAVMQKANLNGNRDGIFPAGIFQKIKMQTPISLDFHPPLYWFKEENPVEKKIARHVKTIHHHIRKGWMLSLVFFVGALLFSGSLVFQKLRK